MEEAGQIIGTERHQLPTGDADKKIVIFLFRRLHRCAAAEMCERSDRFTEFGFVTLKARSSIEIALARRPRKKSR